MHICATKYDMDHILVYIANVIYYTKSDAQQKYFPAFAIIFYLLPRAHSYTILDMNCYERGVSICKKV